jgi:hypothetical protein
MDLFVTPAACAIAAFGGVRPCARAAGRAASSVVAWRKSGIVPAAVQATLLRIAKATGRDLTAEDLVVGRHP